MKQTPPDESPWCSAWLIVPLLIAGVVGSRWPALTLARELNPDESQMMAQALRFAIDLVPWRGVDGTTSGPVNSWFLYLAHAWGVPMGYRSVHALAAVLHAVMCVLTYATLRQVAGKAAAAAGGAAAALAIGTLQAIDFTHFSSETVPALLASAALLSIAARLARPRHAMALDGLAGLLLGTLPFAKLQALPGAAALGGWLAWLILRGDDGSTAARVRRLLVFAGSIALPGVLILGFVVRAGAWDDFWMSYVYGNAAYGADLDVIAVAKKGFRLFAVPSSAPLVGLVLLAALWWRLDKPGWVSADAGLRRFVVASALFACASVLAVLMPRYSFPHHRILFLQPVALVAGGLLALWTRSEPIGSSRVAAPLFVACLVALPLTNIYATIGAARETLALRSTVASLPSAQVARVIRSIAPDAKTLAMWGMLPSLYVDAGIPPGTRHAISQFLIEPSRGREHLRASFLSDIRREQPEVVVDAIADGFFRWTWHTSDRLQSFPALAEYVRENYVLAWEQVFDERREPRDGPAEPVRVYVSHEYLRTHRNAADIR